MCGEEGYLIIGSGVFKSGVSPSLNIQIGGLGVCLDKGLAGRHFSPH